MEENISNIVSQEAFEQLAKLGRMLSENTDTMEQLIRKASEFRRALDSATSIQQMSSAVEGLSQSTQQLNKTQSERLNIEREIKIEGQRMSRVIDEEGQLLEKANAAMKMVAASSLEEAKNIVKLKADIHEYNKRLKDLEKQLKSGAITYADYTNLSAKYTIELQETKVAMSEAQMALKAQTKEMVATRGSYDEMNAKLGQMRDTYRQLDEEERNNAEIGGVLLQGINVLDEKLKALDKTIGNNQRNVGNYDILLDRITNGEVSLRTVMMEMRKDIASLQVQRDQMNDKIRQQIQLTEKLASEQGVESEEYKAASSKLTEMTGAYDKLQNSIEDITRQTAEFNKMQKVQMAEINAETDPNAGINALSQGFGLLANSYQGAISAMALFGGESSELKNTLAKVMIAQQALNAVQQIANDLKKTSLVRIKAEAAWQKIKLAFTKEQTAAEVKNTVATQGAAVATTELAAGEVAATGAAGGLKVAIKAVGTAIKSIPVIGWILAAAAALTTVITLVVKANRESKKGSELQNQMAAATKKVAEAQKEAYSSTSKSVVVLDSNIERLGKCEKGSRQWKEQVKTVSDQLGVSNTWLEKNIDKVQSLRDAWVDMQIALSMADAYAGAIADNTTKMITLQGTLNKIVSTTEYEGRVDAIVEELGISRKLAENYVKARNAYDKIDPSKVGVKRGAYDQMINAQDAITNSLKNQNSVLKDELTNSYNKAADAQQKFADTAPVTTTSGNVGTTAEELAKEAENARKIILDNERALQDLYLKNQKELLSKEGSTLEQMRDMRIEYEEDYYGIMANRYEEDKQLKLAGLKQGSDEYISTEKYYDTVIADLTRRHDENIAQINEEYNQKKVDEENEMWEDIIAADIEWGKKQKEEFERRRQELAEIKEAYLGLGQAVAQAFIEIGNAMSDGIEDSVKQTKIQQALAMAQVLLSQGVALAKAIEAGTAEGASKGSVVAMYAAIATAIGTITAQIITAKNAIKQANSSIAQASAYAEGTDFHKGGAAVVGEGGSPELVMAGGRSYVVDKPTFIRDLPVGAKVVPLTERLSTHHSVDLTKIEESLNGIMGKSVVNINVSDRIVALLSNGQNRTKILNKQFKH